MNDSDVIQHLIEIQDLDGQIRDLEREAKDIPQLKAQENARLSGVNATLQIARHQLDDMLAKIKAEEDEAVEIRARVQQLKIGQASIQSNKEMMQSIMQIETLEMNAQAAEDRALALQDRLPSLQKQVEDAQAKVDAEKGGVDGLIGDLDARLAEVKAELAALEARRAEKVAQMTSVPEKKALLVYERLHTKRWPVVVPLTEVDGDPHAGVCDGCHMKQPPYVAQSVLHKRDIVTCTMCGRILYRDL
ncbi:MAG: zinc ribbon domain-containing protein [Kiritimatiellia bacterium]